VLPGELNCTAARLRRRTAQNVSTLQGYLYTSIVLLLPSASYTPFLVFDLLAVLHVIAQHRHLYSSPHFHTATPRAQPPSKERPPCTYAPRGRKAELVRIFGRTHSRTALLLAPSFPYSSNNLTMKLIGCWGIWYLAFAPQAPKALALAVRSTTSVSPKTDSSPWSVITPVPIFKRELGPEAIGSTTVSAYSFWTVWTCPTGSTWSTLLPYGRCRTTASVQVPIFTACSGISVLVGPFERSTWYVPAYVSAYSTNNLYYT